MANARLTPDVRPRLLLLAWVAVGILVCVGCMPEVRKDPTSASADTATTVDTTAADSSDSGGVVDTNGGTGDAKSLPVGCESHAECSKNKPPPCKLARCNFQTGLCFVADELDDKSCGDGDPCLVDAACKSGKCAFTAKQCDDKNTCTTDACAAGTGCLYLANDNGCDDGDPCTAGDQCQQSACKGLPRTCLGAVEPCIVAPCVAGKGCEIKFAEVLAGQPVICDDGLKCTEGDTCSNGVCKGKSKPCEGDNKPCELTSCQPTDGKCVSSPVTGLACDDGNLCTVSEACALEGCVGVAKKCDDGNPCTVDGCFATTGCFNEATIAECSDNDACTLPDACTEGTCKGTAINCDDGNICTSDSCEKGKGCVHKSSLASCSDGDNCTESDVCAGGLCKGSPLACSDNNACTTDSCGAAGCTFKALKNASSCAGGGQCWAGECVVAECGNTSCEYNETPSSCAKDCPAGGGKCETSDTSCLATCKADVCAAEANACGLDAACGKLETCVTACSEPDCQLACLGPASPQTVKTWRGQRNCLAAKCAKNGWAGKNCKGGEGSFPLCVAACQAAVCYVEEIACYAKVGCQAIDFCVNKCTDGTPSCVKSCFDFGNAVEVELYDQLTLCMNVKCL